MYHLDFETYSAADLKNVGAYRYACDPTARILLCAITHGDASSPPIPPLLWDAYSPDTEESQAALRMIQTAASSGELIYAHNAPFELAVSTYCWQKTFGCPPPAIEKWRCTAAMCRRAAIPWSLAQASDFLGLETKKDKMGSRLIQLFSIPQKTEWTMGDMVTVDSKRMTRAEAWEFFRQYCRRDVEVECEIHRRLKGFELKGDALESFLFDLRMNHYGVPVNADALDKASRMVDRFEYDLSNEFFARTGFKPSQTMAFTHWLQERGYAATDLRMDTVNEWLDHAELTDEAKWALRVRHLLSYAATKKIPTMIDAKCPDNRVRGGFMWSGAIRTHRWSGRIIQPQNFKRPTIKDTGLAYRMIQEGYDSDVFSTLWGSPLEVISSCIRHFIQEPGHDILDADYANIEARITPWLCGQEDMLNEFRRGEDVYVTTAASIFDVPESEVTKDQRFVGKQATLAAQFGVSWKKFQSMCALYGRNLSDEVCMLAIYKYRQKRTLIVQAWRDYQNAAIGAIQNPGEKFGVNKKVEFVYGRRGGFAALSMRLPSGHLLMYPEPEIRTFEQTAEVVKEREDGTLYVEPTTFTSKQISFYGPLPASAQWGRVTTHGSKLLENATQAVGGDFMSHGLIEAEKKGFRVFASIHDQALATFEPERLQTPEDFRRALCKNPSWALDFPLEASVEITPYYTKD